MILNNKSPKEMCEYIVRVLKLDCDPKEIYEISPTGELCYMFLLYALAKNIDKASNETTKQIT